MTRVLITGASGNIGTALLRRLADEPGYDVTALARRIPPAQPPYDTASWRSADLSSDAGNDALRAAMAGVDVVIHLVWAFQPTRDAGYLREVGVGGSERVLHAAAAAGVRHLVHMSSVGTYAPRRGAVARPVDESYPHTGMSTSLYSQHKAAAEAELDRWEREHPDALTITRVRPGIVLQRDAGAALSRYGLPAYLPLRFLPLLPVLPMDRTFAVPIVHADDVADALIRVITARAGGAFNLAAPDPLTRADVAAVFGARAVHVPAGVLRSAADLTWRAHLQPLSPDWLDLAFAAPLLDCGRAHRELGWRARVGPQDAFAQALAGIAENSGTVSPALRARSVTDRLRNLASHGPVSRRRRA